jgi:hypothetical protein
MPIMAASLPSLCVAGSALPVLASRVLRGKSCSKFQWHAESEGIFPSEFWPLFEPSHAIMWYCPFTGFLAKSDKVTNILVLARALLAFSMTAKRRISALYVSACLSTSLFPAQKFPHRHAVCQQHACAYNFLTAA